MMLFFKYNITLKFLFGFRGSAFLNKSYPTSFCKSALNY